MKVYHTKSEVNAMRMTKTDVQVALEIGLEKNSVTRLYGTRASNGLPYLGDGKSRNRDKKEVVIDNKLPKESWVNDTRTAKHIEYWDTSDIIQTGMGPASFIRFNQNSLGTSVH